ncbi:uncharacterized protein LOC135220368 [Macrobrachium nipponense]|uniref:uncharacterized protein LOC135220368 n=1 Tax=Macrobrachium nipponense TaxID=159736 RepID=UPI0030C7C68F
MVVEKPLQLRDKNTKTTAAGYRKLSASHPNLTSTFAMSDIVNLRVFEETETDVVCKFQFGNFAVVRGLAWCNEELSDGGGVIYSSRNKLLVETRSLEESEKLKSLSLLGGVQSECKPHDTFNHTKGIIYAPHLMIHPEEELEDELKDQGVLKVERLKKKVNGALCPMPQLLLTFNSSKLPNFVKAAWYRYKVKQYVRDPGGVFTVRNIGI